MAASATADFAALTAAAESVEAVAASAAAVFAAVTASADFLEAVAASVTADFAARTAALEATAVVSASTAVDFAADSANASSALASITKPSRAATKAKDFALNSAVVSVGVGAGGSLVIAIKSDPQFPENNQNALGKKLKYRSFCRSRRLWLPHNL